MTLRILPSSKPLAPTEAKPVVKALDARKPATPGVSSFQPAAATPVMIAPATPATPATAPLRLTSGGQLTSAPRTEVLSGNAVAATGLGLTTSLRPPRDGVRIASSADLRSGVAEGGALETAGAGAVPTLPAALAVQLAAAKGLGGGAEFDRLAPGASPAEAVESARDDYETAQADVDELNQQLATELDELGPTLDDAGRQQYAADFQARHADEYQAAQAAADHLAEVVNDPAVLEDAKHNPQLASYVYDCVKDLANGTGATAALEWVNTHLAAGSEDAATFAGLRANLDEEILQPGLSNAGAQILADCNGDPDAALAQLNALVTPLKNIASDSRAIQSGLSAIQKAATGDFSELEVFAKGASGAPALGLASLAVAFASVAAIKAGKEGDYQALVQDIAAAGRAGAKVVLGAATALANAGKLLSRTAGAAAAEWLGRLIPALGVTVNGLAFAADLKDLIHDPSLAGAVKAVGDFIATAGALVGTVLPGIGQVIEGVGLLISVLGDALNEAGLRSDRADDKVALLQQQGFTEDEARAIAAASPEFLQAVGSPEDIRALVREQPDLFTDEVLGNAFLDAAHAVEVPPGEYVAFARALARTDGWQELLVSTEVGIQSTAVGGAPVSAKDTVFRSLVESQLSGAYDYTRTHHPGAYDGSHATQQRVEQDIDALATSGLPRDQAVAILLAQHAGDAEYAAELVTQLIDRAGETGENVKALLASASTLDPETRQAVEDALRAANDAGTLSDSRYRAWLDAVENANA